MHAHSARADQMFVPVNSGSLPSELLESILFGHVKGSFTGAVANRKGLFETANRGTCSSTKSAPSAPKFK